MLGTSNGMNIGIYKCKGSMQQETEQCSEKTHLYYNDQGGFLSALLGPAGRDVQRVARTEAQLERSPRS